jgi:hypothetical protein
VKKSLPIQGVYFDMLRRGVKKYELRPLTQRAMLCDPALSHLVFHQYRADQYRADRLECRVKKVCITDVPKKDRSAWSKKYPGEEKCIKVDLTHPRYYVDKSGKSQVVLWS